MIFILDTTLADLPHNIIIRMCKVTKLPLSSKTNECSNQCKHTEHNAEHKPYITKFNSLLIGFKIDQITHILYIRKHRILAYYGREVSVEGRSQGEKGWGASMKDSEGEI